MFRSWTHGALRPLATNHVVRASAALVAAFLAASLVTGIPARPVLAAAPDFTIVALPDTQHYSSGQSGGSPATYTAQTTWIRDTRATLNTVFVTHMGDITDNGWVTTGEFSNASTSQAVLESAGIPSSVLPGNHDSNYASTFANYNAAFPVSRYSANAWYGGSAPGYDNRDSYQLFSVGDLDFIVVNLEYGADSTVRSWASGILAANSSRRAIVVTHDYLTTGGSRSAVGNSIWDGVVYSNCNVFLVLSGHNHMIPSSAARLTSTDRPGCGPVHQVIQDYQDEPNGGNGWLRYYTFRPSENKIYAYTYSPTLGQAGAQFTLDYSMTELTPQTITFGTLADKRLDESPVTVSATASSELTVTFSSTTSSVCTVSGASVTLLSVGTCTIKADQTGNATYAPAPPVNQSFTVGKGNQAITFGAPADKRMDESPFTVSATASSGLAVTFGSSTSSVCSVSGTTVTLLAVGTCTITASQAGNTNWNAASDLSRCE